MRYTKHLLIFIFYIVIAAIVTWPLLTNLSTHLYGDFLTDAYQNAHHTWWMKHAIQTGQPLFFQPMMGYPDGLQGAWLWSNPLELFPGWVFAFFMNINAASNLMMVWQLAMNGWAMFVLVEHLTDNRYAALIAGVIFLAYPAMQGRIYGGHVGVLALWPVPLYLYGLYRRWIIPTAIFFMMGIAGSTSLLIYYLLPVSGIFLLMQLIRKEWAWFKRSLLATAIGCILILILLVPFAIETSNTPQYNTEIGGSVRYSADLLAPITPSFYHPIYKHFDYTGQVLGINLIEGTGYIGIVSGVFLIIGVLRYRRETLPFIILALTTWVFSLGPLLNVVGKVVRIQADVYESYIPLPWGLLQNLPVLSISRTPGRFHLTIGLAVAIMAGYGYSVLFRQRKANFKSVALAALLMALILFDYQMFWPLPSIEADVPDAMVELRERDDIQAVFNIPWEDRILSKRALYLQAIHEQNLIAGIIIRDTPVNPAKLSILQYTLDPILLHNAGADVVILHKGGPYAGNLDALARTQFGEPYYENVDYALFDVPPVAVLSTYKHVTSVDDSRVEYVYTPSPGWILVTGTLMGTGEITLYIDEEPIHVWQVEGEQSFSVSVSILRSGYYTLRFEPTMTCPHIDNPTLSCNEVTVQDVQTSFMLDTLDLPANFDYGVTLERSRIIQTEPLQLALSWYFDGPLSIEASRFVHVVDANGNMVAQYDSGVDTSATRWMETISITGILPEGQYTVYVGWYTLPDIVRFGVTPENPDDVIEIGAFTIGEG